MVIASRSRNPEVLWLRSPAVLHMLVTHQDCYPFGVGKLVPVPAGINPRTAGLNVQRKQRGVLPPCIFAVRPARRHDSAVCTHVFGDGLFNGAMAYKKYRAVSLQNNMAAVKRKHSKGYHWTVYLCFRALQMNSTHAEKEHGGLQTGSSYNSGYKRHTSVNVSLVSTSSIT